jgi:hypothetical protein
MLFPMLLLLLCSACGVKEIPVPVRLQVDETLLDRCPDPLLPAEGKPRRDNDQATVDAYEKLAICQDRHARLADVVRGVNGAGASSPAR